MLSLSLLKVIVLEASTLAARGWSGNIARKSQASSMVQRWRVELKLTVACCDLKATTRSEAKRLLAANRQEQHSHTHESLPENSVEGDLFQNVAQLKLIVASLDQEQCTKLTNKTTIC